MPDDPTPLHIPAMDLDNSGDAREAAMRTDLAAAERSLCTANLAVETAQEDLRVAEARRREVLNHIDRIKGCLDMQVWSYL